MKRIEFTGTLELETAEDGRKVMSKMRDLVRDVDPDFRVNIVGEAMLGSATKDAYERLFGPIAYMGGRWRLAGEPEIHPEIRELVRAAGPNREGCFLA